MDTGQLRQLKYNKIMDFYFRTIEQHEAEKIADDWKYDGIYSFYDFTNDMEDYSRFIDASKRGNNCFSCFTENELIGFYSISKRW